MADVAPTLSYGPRVERFFQVLKHTKGPAAGRPFVLEPWQREFVDEFYRVDANGKRIYRLAVLGIPRGNGKSPLAAGFGLYELLTQRDSPDIFCAAGSKDQAQLVQDFARAFVDSGGLSAAGVKTSRRVITCDRTHGVMRVISSSGSLQHGLSVSAAIVDELHAFMQESQEEVWDVLWTALHKRRNSFALAITTAGFNKATLLGRMYDQALLLPDAEDRHGGCLRIRRDLENGVLFWWYGVPEQLENDWLNEELWRASNPASWIDVDELRKQLFGLGGDELGFKRLHLNMWTASRDAWLPHGVWRACGPEIDPDGGSPEILKIPKGADIWVGVDVGWYHDSTAVSWAARVGDRIVLRSKVWTVDPDSPGEYVPGGKMRLEPVEKFILERLKKQFRIKEVAYDPDYFGRSAEELERNGIRHTVEMRPSSGPTAAAWQAFYQGACEKVISHNGDPVLAAHVNACAVQMTLNGPRVRKAKATQRIDAVAAGSLAYARCELNTRRSGSGQRVWWFDPFAAPADPGDTSGDSSPEKG
ncbi:MAG TPA: terminase large subunit [Gaiellaceae bacterium]|jgi:phage terminase large subunit-like protein|nr:terminase large subunit [Gaiellaceae bacterium]